MDGTQGHLVDVCSCAVPPATVLLSTLSTSCELSRDCPPDSTSFSVAPQTHQPVQSRKQERAVGEPGLTRRDLRFLSNLTEKLHGRPPRCHVGA